MVSTEEMWFRHGPCFFKGKGQKIIKVICRDASGQLRQLWGRTGVFSNDLVWAYDDGQY